MQVCASGRRDVVLTSEGLTCQRCGFNMSTLGSQIVRFLWAPSYPQNVLPWSEFPIVCIAMVGIPHHILLP